MTGVSINNPKDRLLSPEEIQTAVKSLQNPIDKHWLAVINLANASQRAQTASYYNEVMRIAVLSRENTVTMIKDAEIAKLKAIIANYRDLYGEIDE